MKKISTQWGKQKVVVGRNNGVVGLTSLLKELRHDILSHFL